MRRLGRVNVLANVFNLDPVLVYSLVQSDIGKSRDGSCLGIETVVRYLSPYIIIKIMGPRMLTKSDELDPLFVIKRSQEEDGLNVGLCHSSELLSAHFGIHESYTNATE